ncbi:iron ABC transporter ATP-binding protein [Brevibacterium sediminis]|uniref:Iron ABC transporter ATP-binding protein n=1 Tax=Brevibacterium sediminis TaxID=1857024 RepID=A0ABQ1LNC5_9MICO|nr:ABC transporter ATP-binding protein [Brevibacterium sediminis]GGC26733.1 iron ABC transporter ATP-binding protein [Brevibacterium sediminis]
MSEVLNLDSVSVRRGTNFLLDDFSLTVAEGEHWTVLGPNGAGKTTLLEIAAGRMHPTTGTVNILEEQLGRVDVFELRPRIGYASTILANRIPSSEAVLDTVLTAAYGVTGRWVEEYEQDDIERARDLLAAFHITHLADRTFGTLSEGERKRVQIARALMTDPELLLLDEPASGLDFGGREELLGALSEILSSKWAPATIMVTHHVEEIPEGITHVLLLSEGTDLAAGPIEETLTAENLAATFGIDVKLTRDGQRYHARSAL